MQLLSHPQAPLPDPTSSAAPPDPHRERRRRLRWVFSRDTDSFARRWPGKLLVAIVLLAIPAAMVLASLRAGRYADNSWTALLTVAVLAGTYVISRRLLLTLLVAGLVVSLASWVLTPHLVSTRTGDGSVLTQLDDQRAMGVLDGFHEVSVAQIDLGAAQRVRFAGLGADATTPVEVGSLTKAMTGLVIADAARRGEIRMGVPVSTYLPKLAGSPAGTVTMHELVTHTAGYAEFGPATLHRALWSAPVGEELSDHRSGTADAGGPRRHVGDARQLRLLQSRCRHCRPGCGRCDGHELREADAHSSLRASRDDPHSYREPASTRPRR